MKYKSTLDGNFNIIFSSGLTYLQLYMSFIVFCGCLIERYPVSLYALKFNAQVIQKYQLQTQNGLQTSQNIIDILYLRYMQLMQLAFYLFDRRPEFVFF